MQREEESIASAIALLVFRLLVLGTMRTGPRERDTNANSVLDERTYNLHNWRNDVVAIMNYDGQLKERVTYDAYGRPHAFSPGDIKTAGGADRPDGTLNSSDTWTTGSVVWNKDLGNSSHVAIPDGVTSNGTSNTDDPATLVNLKAAGYSAGYGILSDSAVGNRRGFAGYEFDPILEGAAAADNKPVYHVRHRVLASDTGKWFQKDPLGYHDSMDLYEYCGSDPQDNTDAYGTVAASTACSNCVDPPDPSPWLQPSALNPLPIPCAGATCQTSTLTSCSVTVTGVPVENLMPGPPTTTWSVSCLPLRTLPPIGSIPLGADPTSPLSRFCWLVPTVGPTLVTNPACVANRTTLPATLNTLLGIAFCAKMRSLYTPPHDSCLRGCGCAVTSTTITTHAVGPSAVITYAGCVYSVKITGSYTTQDGAGTCAASTAPNPSTYPNVPQW